MFADPYRGQRLAALEVLVNEQADSLSTPANRDQSWGIVVVRRSVVITHYTYVRKANHPEKIYTLVSLKPSIALLEYEVPFSVTDALYVCMQDLNGLDRLVYVQFLVEFTSDKPCTRIDAFLCHSLYTNLLTGHEGRRYNIDNHHAAR